MGRSAASADVSGIEGSFKARSDGKAAVSRRGMVSTAFPEATAAGVSMLKRGGNAADAACASALALAVCEPQASGLGGQTMALVHADGRTVSVDGSSRAPSLADRHAPADRQGLLVGYGATTVPTTVATLGYLEGRYGCLDWQTVLEPAIRIARRGYRITPLQHRCQAENLDRLLQTVSGARYFLKDCLVPYDPGDLFVQEDLAHTLEMLSQDGHESFYRGHIADMMDVDMRRNGGLLRRGDLAATHIPVERRPVCRTYRGVRICTMPPPGAGHAMLLVMMVLRRVSKRRMAAKGLKEYHYVAEALRRALVDRARRPLRPGARGLAPSPLDSAFVRRVCGAIRAGDPPGDAAVSEGGGETTHLSVMDSEGNAVSLTQSIELVYGSKAAAGGMGFLYNDYMSAFETDDATHPYYLRPDSVPVSWACPSVAFLDGEPWMALGSPGSARIVSAVSLFLSRVADEGDSIYDSMERPRMHCSADGTISLEESDDWDGLAEHLASRGYRTNIRERRSFYMGAIHAVLRRVVGTGFQGVAEVRRDGVAGGV